jgi:succinate-semialdehyde dehydrogenase / glutarate-semialdehyde dehydrogenase
MEMFIDGAWRPALSGRTLPVLNPATGALIDHVPDGEAGDADIAFQAAQRAFPLWRATPVGERARLQKAAAATMRVRSAEFATMLTAELGRPLAAARHEIERTADLLDVYAEEGLRLREEATLGAGGERIVVTREPVGVVAAIAPFNYPINLLAFKLGAALIAGCTIVAKPASDTPLTTLMLAELFSQAGFPKGVINVVTGSGSKLGMAMVEHPIPRKIAFTGGTVAGKAIAAAAAGTMKRVTLELGGQCPAIVCADSDIERAAAAIARHAFANSGQFCYRVNRVYVQQAVYGEFLARLETHVTRHVVGDPLDGATTMGPLVNEKIFGNAERHVADARAKGARVVTGGARLTGGLFDAGWFHPPTILTDATPDMLVMREETFGPVLGVAPFDTLDEAVSEANATRYGLAGFVFAREGAAARALADRIEAGSVWVNDIHRSSHYAPFGGTKESGLGREKGRYGVEAYLEYKTLYLSPDARA